MLRYRSAAAARRVVHLHAHSNNFILITESISYSCQSAASSVCWNEEEIIYSWQPASKKPAFVTAADSQGWEDIIRDTAQPWRCNSLSTNISLLAVIHLCQYREVKAAPVLQILPNKMRMSKTNQVESNRKWMAEHQKAFEEKGFEQRWRCLDLIFFSIWYIFKPYFLWYLLHNSSL